LTRLRSKLTYANVMSTIAVFAVLAGGGAYAAQKLKKNSVKTKNIRNKAVTEAKIGDKAVTNPKIGDKQVKTGKLGEKSVTNAKLDDGAVTPGKTSFAFASGRISLDPAANQTLNQTLAAANGLSLIAECGEDGGGMHSGRIQAIGPGSATFIGVLGTQGDLNANVIAANGLPANLVNVNPTGALVAQHASFDVTSATNTISAQVGMTINPASQSGDCLFSASGLAG
jgi:hypothetical protein